MAFESRPKSWKEAHDRYCRQHNRLRATIAQILKNYPGHANNQQHHHHHPDINDDDEVDIPWLLSTKETWKFWTHKIMFESCSGITSLTWWSCEAMTPIILLLPKRPKRKSKNRFIYHWPCLTCKTLSSPWSARSSSGRAKPRYALKKHWPTKGNIRRAWL